MECKNCKHHLSETDHFCPNCGARVIGKRLTFKFFFAEFLEKVLSVDNKLLKTFWHLIIKPDVVIKSYVDGVRKRYLEPFSYLLISITLSGISILLMRESAIDSMAEMNTTQSELMAQFYKDMMNFIYDYNAFITALTIPLYALISWIVFYNKKLFNYVEHVILYMYSTAQFSVLNTFVFVLIYYTGIDFNNGIMMFTLLASIIYNTYILTRIFKLTSVQLIIKFLYFLAILLVFYIIFGLLAGVIMMLTIDPETLKQFAPQKQAIYDASWTLNCLSYKFL